MSEGDNDVGFPLLDMGHSLYMRSHISAFNIILQLHGSAGEGNTDL